jgi:ABC-2 type transport system permease protein
MSEPVAAGRTPGADLWLLARCRAAQLRNLVDQQLREAPGRSFIVLALLVAFWAALYVLLWQVLKHVHGWGLVGVVADQHLFVHFFLVLAVMLTFSNAILTFSSLYGREEAGFLLGMPLHAREVVFVKWFEGVALSSWSFLLLGVPLMLAIARNAPVQWYYYPLFLGHFLGFVAIPACLGLLAAWAVAMWAPRRPLAVAIASATIVILLTIYWLSNISENALESEEWLRVMFKQLGLVKQPLLPSTWTAKGIVGAMRQDVAQSLFYLLVVLGNGAFLSWLTVNLLGRSWPEAYSRAQRGRVQPTIRRGWVTEIVCWVLFFYLPVKLRQAMLKDLRGFARDARQWSQMLIMFGLLVIYVLNLRRLPVDLNSAHFKGLVAFLNLTTVSLILATFTSRFVYPLLSLESQQLWLLELLPIRRRTLLMVKFLFALTVTGLSACVVMGLAVKVLDLPAAYAWLNVAVCLGVCVGLSGLSIGLGARFPVLGNRNPARIASGFGGTLNLIVSMAFVSLEMAGVGVLSYHEMSKTFVLDGTFSPTGWWMLFCLLALSVVVALLSLVIGGRHFERLEY